MASTGLSPNHRPAFFALANTVRSCARRLFNVAGAAPAAWRSCSQDDDPGGALQPPAEPDLIELERRQGFGIRQLVIECPPKRLRGQSRFVHWGQTTLPRDRARGKRRGDPDGVAVEKPGISTYRSSPRRHARTR